MNGSVMATDVALQDRDALFGRVVEVEFGFAVDHDAAIRKVVRVDEDGNPRVPLHVEHLALLGLGADVDLLIAPLVPDGHRVRRAIGVDRAQPRQVGPGQ